MDHDVDDDTLRDLEAGLYPQRRHTRDASNSDYWLTNMKNSFTRPALGIFQNRVSSHQHAIPGYAEDDDDVHANDEDLTGMNIMFQIDNHPTKLVNHTDCSEQTGVSCVSPRNTMSPNNFCFYSPIASLPSATSSNTPPLTPDASVGILHTTSPEIADTQSSLLFSSHITRKTPTPPLEPEHVCPNDEGKMPESPRCFDSRKADITLDPLQDAQPPRIDDGFEEWYWLDYALKLSRGDRCSSESEHRSAGEPSYSRKPFITLHRCGMFPPSHTKEDQEHLHWRRKHRHRDREEARQRRQAMADLR